MPHRSAAGSSDLIRTATASIIGPNSDSAATQGAFPHRQVAPSRRQQGLPDVRVPLSVPGHLRFPELASRPRQPEQAAARSIGDLRRLLAVSGRRYASWRSREDEFVGRPLGWPRRPPRSAMPRPASFPSWPPPLRSATQAFAIHSMWSMRLSPIARPRTGGTAFPIRLPT